MLKETFNSLKVLNYNFSKTYYPFLTHFRAKGFTTMATMTTSFSSGAATPNCSSPALLENQRAPPQWVPLTLFSLRLAPPPPADWVVFYRTIKIITSLAFYLALPA
jgi:hypothetical protein